MKILFDIKYKPQIESGEYKVETRDGTEARIICWDACKDEPIVAVVSGLVHQYTLHGYANYLKDIDLFIVTPEPELTEFEQGYIRIAHKMSPMDYDDEGLSFAKQEAAELLDLARKEILKGGNI